MSQTEGKRVEERDWTGELALGSAGGPALHATVKMDWKQVGGQKKDGRVHPPREISQVLNAFLWLWPDEPNSAHEGIHNILEKIAS